MDPFNCNKKTFMTDIANFCYKAMSFVLKTMGATYQIMMDKVFKSQIGDMVEVYMEYMIVKSKLQEEYTTHLKFIFT